MLQARLDRRFVARSMERGRARFSPRSDVYAVIRSVHRQLRAKEAAQAGGRLGLALPTSTRTFYNQRFDAAQERISPLLEAARIPERFKARARALYGFRLRRGATLGELLSCDVYATQTYNMDFPLELALAGLSPRRDRAWGFNATHVFLHRPQHSVFIYLHEILVGGCSRSSPFRSPALRPGSRPPPSPRSGPWSSSRRSPASPPSTSTAGTSRTPPRWSARFPRACAI